MIDASEPVIQNVINGATGGALTKWTPSPLLNTNVQDSDPDYQGAWWTRGEGPVWSNTPNEAQVKQAAEEIGYHEDELKSQLNTIYTQEATEKAPALNPNSIWSTPSGGLVPSFSANPPPQGPVQYRYTLNG